MQFIVGRRPSQEGSHPHWLWEHVCIKSEEEFSVNTNFLTSCPNYINPGYIFFVGQILGTNIGWQWVLVYVLLLAFCAFAVFPSQTWKGVQFIVGRQTTITRRGSSPLTLSTCLYYTNVFTSLHYYVNPGFFLFWKDTGNRNWLAVSAGCTYYCLLSVPWQFFHHKLGKVRNS